MGGWGDRERRGVWERLWVGRGFGALVWFSEEGREVSGVFWFGIGREGMAWDFGGRERGEKFLFFS